MSKLHILTRPCRDCNRNLPSCFASVRLLTFAPSHSFPYFEHTGSVLRLPSLRLPASLGLLGPSFPLCRHSSAPLWASASRSLYRFARLLSFRIPLEISLARRDMQFTGPYESATATHVSVPTIDDGTDIEISRFLCYTPAARSCYCVLLREDFMRMRTYFTA